LSRTWPSPQTAFWRCAYSVTALLFLWIAARLPVVAIPEAAVDDALFVRQAISLLKGDWLGSYDNLTLAKGVGYPVWLALLALVGAPVLFGQAALYVCGAALLVAALAKWLPSRAARFGLFVLLLGNPALYGVETLRVIREGLYTPTLLMVLALLLWWLSSPGGMRWQHLLRATLLGIVLALFYLTREEAIWIAPLLLGFAALRAAVLVQQGGAAAVWRDAAALGLCMAAAILPVLGVAAMNARNYGVMTTVEFKEAAFVSAYGAVARLGAGAPSLVVLPSTRTGALYAASPAAAELRSYFERGGARAYVEVGCATYGVEPCDGEVRAGWFMWALREAAAEAGYHRSGRAARDYYRRLAREVGAACAEGRLACLPGGDSLAPPFHSSYLRPTLNAAVHLLAVPSRPAEVPSPAALRAVGFQPPNPQRSLFLDFVSTPAFVPAPWLGAPDPPGAGSDRSVSLALSARALGLVNRWTQAAAPLLLGLQILGLAALFVLLGLWQRMVAADLHHLYGFALLCLLTYATRIALLAYLDTVAIPSINLLYLSPAMTPLLIATSIPVLIAARLIAASRRGQSQRH
jgi:hypothetical protein